MEPGEYGICVVSGNDAIRGPLRADAYVYAWGGRNMAVFSAQLKCPSRRAERKAEAALRRQVKRDANAWIAAQEQAA